MKTFFSFKNISWKAKIALVLSLLGMPTLSKSQEQNLPQKLTQHSQRAVQEKMFVHLDRPLYVVGESIWFKAICVDALLHHPLDMSKVAYLDVLDKEHNPVLQTKIALEKGKGNGSLFIPPFLQSGHYSVRCYTNWMKNFSPDFYFETTITIANPFSKPTFIPSAAPTLTYDLQLFPEGGQLVQGLESKVGFRATDIAGKGIKFDGTIVNQQNDTVVRFEPLKFGIGSFQFKPQMGEKYRVLLKDAQKKWLVYNLPTVQEKGFLLKVTDSTARWLKVEVVSNASSNASVYILAHTKGSPKYAEKKILKEGQSVFLINKSDLADGITSITLFDELQKPLCERLYFKRPAQNLSISAKTDKSQYAPRQKIELDLGTTGKGNTPTLADLSVSVYLVDSLPVENHPMIESYLGLSSDLKGNVESPQYYFNNTDETANTALDNLMLTHGWRRFNWDEVLEKQKLSFDYIPENGGHFIRGKVVNPQTGAPVPWVNTYLAAPSKRPQLFVSTSDAQGRIAFEMKHFFGSQEVVVQTNTQVDTTSRIEILSPFSDKFGVRTLPSFAWNATWKNNLQARSINMQTYNAFLPKWAQQMTTGETDTLAFFGKPDERYLLDAYTRFPTMEEVMREYVPGVVVRKRQGKFRFRVVDLLQPNVLFEEEPLVLMDGVPVFDTDKIIAFDPLKVKKLEVIDGLYYLGTMSFSGIVSYTTYKGDMAGFPIDPRALVLSYEGVQGKKEFYAPRYDTETAQKTRVPDFRNLLHWSPQLMTNAEGKASVNFYASEQLGTYKIVVQGLTNDGQAGSKTATFEVKKATL
ncbi:hypothetical protein [Runella zeae]|uniref:hypothetical protein n=1 Tax=Runella zeae TaxID=94255 RepID=UPI00040238B9|nr:hypothetical protein [Runella zeae]